MKRLLVILTVIALTGCGYKFNGASTVGLKTINVQFFENNAPLVVPNLSQQFTEALKERIRNQSKLNLVQGEVMHLLKAELPVTILNLFQSRTIPNQ